jgi:zinc transport system substrate-binding protein
MTRRRALRGTTLLALPTVLSVAGCAMATEPGGGSTADGVRVLASFYPLQYVAEQVGGDLVTVQNLTPPSAEPHDIELSPAQVRRVGDADLVVYLTGFQPAVDEAVEARAPEHVVDAADVVTLEEAPGSVEHSAAGEHTDEGHAEDAHTEEEHAEEEHEEEGDGHDHGSLDPHFWLDPTRLVPVAHAVAEQLAAADPDNADAYAAGADALERRLTSLDEELTGGLGQCTGSTLVTAHTAFGYLAERYGLEQVGISIDPESEPSPARLREIGAIVRSHHVETIFTETLTSPKVAETLARDLGVTTRTLDPLEGISEDAAAAGEDYESVMRANAAALQEGLVCS